MRFRDHTTPRVPVLIYHSIADDHDHPWKFLSIPVGLFEKQLIYLQRKGFNTITLYDLYSYLQWGTKLPPKSIVLTFDDGFLDNWVHAFPLLKKYGMRATIFVATDFIDSSEACRPTLEDVWSGSIVADDLQWWGYLRWSELKKMHDSGLIDVQSHTQTHTWYFTTDEVIDFHHPGDDYVWLLWNMYPKSKPHWLHPDFHAAVPWGRPVYDFGQALLCKRYYDDPHLAQAVIDYVARSDHRAFFHKPAWKDELFNVVASYRASTSPEEHYETDQEYLTRSSAELRQSKMVLEQHLQKTVDFLCWPCGDFTDTLHKIAIDECGYWSTVTVQYKSNTFGDDPAKIRRTYFGHYYTGPWKSRLMWLNFWGTVHSQRGLPMVYYAVPLANRLHRLSHAVQKWGG